MNALSEMGKAARAASRLLKNAPTSVKNEALRIAAQALRADTLKILDANARDVSVHPGLGSAERDRLMLNEARIEAMAAGLETVAALPDPVGGVIARWQTPNGLRFSRVRVPLGVIGVIFESRPNVTADAAALCLKSGNACLLRPGSESFESSRAIAEAMRKGIEKSGLPVASVQLVPSPDRAYVGDLLTLEDDVDVIVPRGGKSLIARVKAESRVPVLAHLDGNNHVVVAAHADCAKAISIVLNAKMRRTGICGAAETLLVDRAVLGTHLAPLVRALLEVGCELRGDADVQSLDPRVKAAVEADWATEYLDAVLAVKIVNGLDEAMAHIERYGSHHTDAIVTEDALMAETFLAEVDSAIVLWNASTQFADGGEFGMGAEIGIATGRLHARGPVGLEQLTTFKTVVRGEGQTRA